MKDGGLSPADLAEARRLILDLLRGPWTSMSPWATTNACTYLEHPSKLEERDAGCICGFRSEPAPEWMAGEAP